MRIALRIGTLAALALLAACQDKPTAPDATQGSAARGDVLPGSISDAMLPLDTVRSQAPPRVESGDAASDTGADVSANSGSDGSDADSDTDAGTDDGGEAPPQ